MNNWIDDSIELDFAIPKDIQNMMKECEELNAAEDNAYFNYSEFLGYMCKKTYVRGHLTKKQWELIERKYESE